MLKEFSSLAKVKNLLSNEMSIMDELIDQRLQGRDKLVKDITYHIIKSGGKRLRPCLLILIAKLFSYNGDRHINLAAAVEFIHTATLLHDDVVDHSDLRRGKLTANYFWDNKSSILVGDFLFSQAFMLMAEDKDVEILKILSQASSIIAEGEVKQLSSIANLNLNIDNYIKIISAKTAELFAASCMVGAVIAGADKMSQNEMYKLGLNLGIAFQIIDDILDYSTENKQLGKNIGDDFRESKVTLPIIKAYKVSDKDEKNFWQRIFNDKVQNEGDLEKAVGILKKNRTIEECYEIAKYYANQAKLSLSSVPDNELKKITLEMIEFSLIRNF